MSQKVKIQREFTFKAYTVNEGVEVLNNVHTGEILSKSECHYYCEKAVLDYVKANFETVKKDKLRFAIYKVCTLEDNNREDVLIELISVKDDMINIQ